MIDDHVNKQFKSSNNKLIGKGSMTQNKNPEFFQLTWYSSQPQANCFHYQISFFFFLFFSFPFYKENHRDRFFTLIELRLKVSKRGTYKKFHDVNVATALDEKKWTESQTLSASFQNLV